MKHLKKHRLIAALAAWVCLATAADAAVVWNETVNGDISGDRLAPSSAALQFGSNTLTATSVGTGAASDREYITFSMPPASRLSAIYLNAYASLDEFAFIGVQSGTTFTEPTGPSPPPNAGNILGYTHFGPAVEDAEVGDNMLPGMGEGYDPGFEAMGFTPPLAGGNYTFWIQQTGANSATYTLDFLVTPEPTSWALFVIGAALAHAANRRRSV